MISEPVIGSFQLMKSINRSLILNIIRTYGPIARSEIAKMTKLTPPTVTNLVNELLEEGLVVEGQAAPSSGGRKPILLSVVVDRYYVIGVDVSARHVRFAVTNLEAKVIDSYDVPIEANLDEQHFIQLLIDELQAILHKSWSADIIGIGIGMNGIVDYNTGVSIYAPSLNIKQMPLKASLEASLSLPVFVENDARAMALGESWFGSGFGFSDLLCVNVGTGISAGFIHNGQLFRGTSSIAGGIGHTVIVYDGPECSCGNRGCLQSLAAHEGVVHHVHRLLAEGRTSLITELVDGDITKVDGAVVYEAAVRGDEVALEVWRIVGQYLGIAVTNAIHLYNPKRIAIGGGIAKAGDFIFETLRAVVKQHALTDEAKETEIVPIQLGDEATLIGAATLVLNNFFLPQTNNY